MRVAVRTAGSKGAGGASTLQLVHGSEIAHWMDAQAHMAGLLQAVPDLPGTEVILESTGAGMAGLFFDMAQAAQRGDGDYQLIAQPIHNPAPYLSAAVRIPVGFARPGPEVDRVIPSTAIRGCCSIPRTRSASGLVSRLTLAMPWR